MKLLSVILCIFLLAGSPELFAQTAGSSQTTTMADRSPSENNSGAAIRERSPGSIVTAARARHLALREARLAAQRSGDNSNLLQEETATSGASGNLLANLLNGATGSLISTFLGGSGGSTLITNPGSSSTGSGTSTGSNNFSNLPPEVLQMLTSFGINVSDLQNAKQTQTAGETASKTSQTSQTSTTTTTTTTPFVTRWANAMLSTLFSSLTIAVQSSSFLNLVKDAFRPLFGLDKASDTTNKASSLLLPQRTEFERFRSGGVEGRYCSAFI